MKLKIYTLLLALSVTWSLQSCDNDDDGSIAVPAELQSAFSSKFPNAANVKWETKSGYYVADFYDGYEASAWFTQDGKWQMTETDIPYNALPQAVKTSFESSEYASWKRDDIDKLERTGVETVFVIEVEKQVLLNFMDSGLYEREGKALTNFTRTLPDEASDLAQELTKDPYNFAFTGITKPYNEQILKDALLANISQFLLELGTGFAYVGKEYRLQIGQKEKFIDLLFYNINLSCYVVIEVKIGEFDFQDLGQLSGYVVACNHILKKEGRDNPTIGLLICRQKDSLLAQYALEGSNLPLGISEYELSKLYPKKVDGTIPTIEEIEAKLGNKDKS